MNEALNQYIENIDEMARKLSESETRALLQQIGRQIRQNNKRRIQANIEPSGGNMQARQGLPVKPLNNLKKEQEFIYHGTIHRYRTMRDYGSYLIGYDYHTDNTFKAKKAEIMQHSERSKLMFRKIHQYKFLKLKANSHEAAIGFLGGLVGYIANAHQHGADNRPVRELLVFSNDDLQLIENMLKQHFQAA